MNNQNNESDTDKTLEEAIDAMESQYDGEQQTFRMDENEELPPSDSPEELIVELEQQLADHKKRELMAQAELENFRKRMIRDSEQQLRYASLPLIRDVLEVVDNLARATEAAKSAGDAQSNSLLQGVVMVNQQLMNALAKYQCVPIEALGKEFDPNFHEAISQAPSTEFASGEVMYEATKGYRMYDRVVRPAQVIVSTGSPES